MKYLKFYKLKDNQIIKEEKKNLKSAEKVYVYAQGKIYVKPVKPLHKEFLPSFSTYFKHKPFMSNNKQSERRVMFARKIFQYALAFESS